jgi:signal transduction histidine kinase
MTAASSNGPTPGIGSDDGDLRILVVDDTSDMRLLMRVLLDRYVGLRVIGEAENGVEAIELAEVRQPDLIMLDLAMPEMDGLEALPHLLRVAPDAQVIVLSAFGADSMASAALAAGATSYVQKGASPQELVTAVADAVGRPVPELKAPRQGETSPGRPSPAGPRSLSPAGTTDGRAGARPAGWDAGAAAVDRATRLIARTAHELRNPVITLGMIVDQLLGHRATMAPETVDELLHAMLRQVAVLDRLTDDVLTSTAARRGALVVHPIPLELREVLEETLASWGGSELTLDCPPGLLVEADRLRLQQMVGNLVSNALKYGAPPVDVIGSVAGGSVEIRVRDHGGGVPADFRDRLFDEYTRADPEAGAGTGLGLFIVASLAHAHGGSVRLAPDEPGTTFVLTLPRAGRR